MLSDESKNNFKSEKQTSIFVVDFGIFLKILGIYFEIYKAIS
jgi:hypothetical protein